MSGTSDTTGKRTKKFPPRQGWQQGPEFFERAPHAIRTVLATLRVALIND